MPSALNGDKIFPFRPNSQLSVQPKSAYSQPFHAQLTKSVAVGQIRMDVSTSLHLLHHKIHTKNTTYTLCRSYDSAMAKYQRNFLENYNPFEGPVTRKMCLISNLLGCPSDTPIYSTRPPVYLQNDFLNDEQFRILERVLRNRDLITSVESGPGVGKTLLCTTIIENILLEDPSSLILVCCNSNNAIDHLAISVNKYLMNKPGDVKKVRIYAKDREPLSDPQLHSIALHKLITTATLNNSSLNTTAADCDKLQQQISELPFLRENLSPNEKQNHFMATSALVKQHRNLQHELSEEYLCNFLQPKIVFTTLASANDHRLRNFSFDCLIIDEAAAASPLEIHLV
ncbi:MAG: hypothetical protein GY820_24080 [Gammaproteobacteria bacterium]|nr:hypothetical protein [Gammaproteobacteria bacterium]